MRKRGKKIEFNSKDCYSLDSTLKPIIFNGLVTFKKTILERIKTDKTVGIPMYVGHGDDAHGDLDKWIDTLNKMIYAFGDTQPNINDYPFDFIWIDSEGNELSEITSGEPFNLQPSRQEIYEQFKEDEKEHNLKVQEGLDLFAKHFQDLWY